MQGHSASNPDADGTDLPIRTSALGCVSVFWSSSAFGCVSVFWSSSAFGYVSEHPDARPTVNPVCRKAELRTHGDHRLFQPSHVVHDIDRLGERDDRIGDELARAVPGDLPAAVHVDDG